MHFLVTCQPQSSKSSNKKNRENKQREEFNLYCKKGKSDSDKTPVDEASNFVYYQWHHSKGGIYIKRAY